MDNSFQFLNAMLSLQQPDSAGEVYQRSMFRFRTSPVVSQIITRLAEISSDVMGEISKDGEIDEEKLRAILASLLNKCQ